MRFSDRSSILPPKGFNKSGSRDRRKLEDYLSLNEKERLQNRPKFGTSYNSEDVREKLFTLFNGNCAYCESHASTIQFMDVEHFRPKMAAGNDQKSTRPDYYAWLAYTWENLLLSCKHCNVAKRNLFPVQGQRAPFKASVDECRKAERAMLIDPCYDHPAEHLSFSPDGVAIALTKRGHETINLLTLNREALVTERQRVFGAIAQQLIFEPAGVKTIDTASEFAPERHIPANMSFPGAITAMLLGFFDHENLKTLLAELDSKTHEQRTAMFVNLLESDGRIMKDRAWSEGKSPWSFLENVTKVVESIFTGEKEGVIYRTQFMDEMAYAEDHINHFVIKNYKAIRELKFDFPKPKSSNHPTPCLMLLGENATGKSSVLEAIALTLLGRDQITILNKKIRSESFKAVDLIHRVDFLDNNSVSDTPINIRLNFAAHENPLQLGAGAKDRTFSGPLKQSKLILAYGAQRYFKKNNKDIGNPGADHVQSLFDPRTPLADPTDWLLNCNQKDFEAAARAIREILMLDNKDKFMRDKNTIWIDVGTQKTPFEALSTGYKSIMSLVVDIIRKMLVHADNVEKMSAVVMIDEIGTHLHPRWKLTIMQRLRKALPHVQFIATTHDPLCLKGMLNGEIIVLERDESDMIRKIEDLPNIQGMRAEQILRSEYFGLGTTNPELDAKYMRYHDLARKNDLDPGEVEEKTRLGSEISDMLVVGDTFVEQVAYEAAKHDVFHKDTPVRKVKGGSRKEMLKNMFTALEATKTATNAED
ncbi:AAA family ATPase [Hellea sp.]|nr:AAA family ATPase [Hellea sp.]